MTELSEIILSEHAEGLDAFAHHAFFAAVEDGSLTAAAARAYFINERGFVEQAVVVFAHILAKAPTLSSRRHLHAILQGLLYSQLDLFDAIQAELGIPRDETADVSVPAGIRAVYDGFTAIARDGSYASGLAAMLVAESTYARVSDRLTTSPPRDPLLRNWFALHAQPEFLGGVAWLRQELDQLGRTGVTAGDVSGAVSSAIALEIAFHDEPLRNASAG